MPSAIYYSFFDGTHHVLTNQAPDDVDAITALPTIPPEDQVGKKEHYCAPQFPHSGGDWASIAAFGSIELAKELGGIGRSGSVLDAGDLRAMVDDTMSRYGRIDAVVSNMGHGGSVPEAIKTVGFDPDFDGPLLELTDELWHESLDMYVLNVVKLARIVTPIMIEQRGGAFVNISSMNTIEPRAPYPMSMLRAALHSFSKLYGDRYARYNIRMNNLLPGFCENVNLSEFARKSIPAQRPATFEEIGQAWSS